MHPAVSLALLIFGVLILVGIITPFIDVTRSAKWPVVEGEITDSTVELRKRENKCVYSPRIEYRFSVDGQTYTGSRISGAFGVWWASEKKSATRMTRRFPKGSVCSVYYHPRNPRSCLLQPGLQLQDLIFLAIPAVFIGLGWYFLP